MRHGTEEWDVTAAPQRRLYVLELKCLISNFGSTRKNRIWDENILIRIRELIELSARVDKKVVRWMLNKVTKAVLSV